MSYDIRRNSEGEMLVLPLELPLYDGSVSDFGQQAEVSLASTLRHAAVCEWMYENLDLTDSEVLELYEQERSQMSAKLIHAMISLASIADNMGIDIMQEIWEMPWEV